MGPGMPVTGTRPGMPEKLLARARPSVYKKIRAIPVFPDAPQKFFIDFFDELGKHNVK